MSREERTGNRRKTRKSNFRKFDLGNYLIVTDALKTEENYLNGFIRSLPESFQQRINLKIVHCRTHELVERCLEIAAAEPQYSENWIVFDRDRVVGFDSLISSMEKKGIHAGWSNPCIEIWFFSYFTDIPGIYDSVECCKRFSALFYKKTGRKYDKAEWQIHELLSEYGNEEQALRRAKLKEKEHNRDGNNIPSKMCPCTVLYKLIEEIRSRII